MFGKTLNYLSKLTIILLVVLPSLALAVTLSATANRSHIDIEETLELTVRLDTQAAGNGPDFSALEMNFDILSNNRSTQYRSINGKAESWTEWKLLLSPKKIGQLLIPSISYQGLYTEAQVIEVKQQTQSANGDVKSIFIEASVAKESVSVQEQLILTIKLYTSINLRSINSEELIVDDALQVELSELRYQKRINGKPYAVIEVKYALFPQTSGTLHIPTITYTATTKGRVRDPWSDPFGTQAGEIKRLKTKAFDVKVTSAPATYSGEHWLPSSKLGLDQEWSSDPTGFKVGEPITRIITLTADGLTGAQLPPLSLPAVSGIKYYPDQPQTQDQTNENGLTGIRTETIALVPMKSGKMTLPEISLSWWDTHTNTQRKATLPSTTINVAPAAGMAVPQPSANTAPIYSANKADAATRPAEVLSWPWIVACALLSLLCLTLAVVNRRLKKAVLEGASSSRELKNQAIQAQHESEQAAFQAMKKACENDDLLNMRSTIITWGKSRWPRENAINLDSIGELSGDENIQHLLQALDADIYRGGEAPDANSKPWSGKDFIQYTKAIRSKNVTRRQSGKRLKALYPASE